MSLVLVVDDEPAVLQVLCDVVEDLGHDVVRATNGHEALALAQTHHPALIISDHMMPALSGVDLCRELRRDSELKDIPVLLLSGVLTHGIPEAQAFLAKPFELSDFERVVTDTIRQKAPPAEWSSQKRPDLIDRLELGLQAVRGSLIAARASSEICPSGLALEEQIAGLLDSIWGARPPTTLALERLDLAVLVDAVVAEWRQRCPSLEFSSAGPSDGTRVAADAFRLRQLVDILMLNAVGGGGRGPIAIEVKVADAHVDLQVEGTALADRQGEAARLSRDVAFGDHLARLHGGTLRFSSGDGKRRFNLRLPQAGN